MLKTWAPTSGWEYPLEKGTATHSSFFGLENSTDRGAWQATVHVVTIQLIQSKRFTPLASLSLGSA